MPETLTAPPATVPTVKEMMQRLVTNLPDDATWKDVKYTVGLFESIQAGLRAGAEGRMVSHDEVCRRFRVTP